MLSWYLVHRERLELKKNTAFELFHCEYRCVWMCDCVFMYGSDGFDQFSFPVFFNFSNFLLLMIIIHSLYEIFLAIILRFCLFSDA